MIVSTPTYKMYSGSDSTESQKYSQWPLNPSAYQNTPNDQIDWAALAQQWIIMKEAGPPVPEQAQVAPPLKAPPPPQLSNSKKEPPLNEGGEAPMEVVNDKEDTSGSQWSENGPPGDGPWNWNQPQASWGWGNSWNGPPSVPPPGGNKPPLLPTPAPSFNQFSTAPPSDNGNFGNSFNRMPPNEYSAPGAYWNSGGNKLKPHNKRYSKVNMPRPSSVVPPPVVPEPVVTLDANKRKQLPAWIREGLEKMERDKQKQLEKEREELEKQEQAEKTKIDEKEALEIIKSTVKEREGSKFESEGEFSEEEKSQKGLKSHTPEPVMISHDELMLKVRRTMTEILLNVTNQEILAVCKEEFQRYVKKRKASSQHAAASSGSNISAKLGLGIYGDSGSSSEGSEEDQNERDSDIELRNSIKRKKADFSKTEKEIEERLTAAEQVNHRNDGRGGGTPKTDDFESQVDAKDQGHKAKNSSKYHKSRRSSSSSNESNRGKRKDKRRSSSSDTDKGSSSSRERTPERRKPKQEYRSEKRSYNSKSRPRKSISPDIKRRRRKSNSRERNHLHNKTKRRRYTRRSNSRSNSGSRRSSSSSRSRTRSHRSSSRRRSRSPAKHWRHRRSRTPERSRRRSRSYSRDDRSRSRDRRRSRSRSHRRRRSRSLSSSRGKRSRRH